MYCNIHMYSYLSLTCADVTLQHFSVDTPHVSSTFRFVKVQRKENCLSGARENTDEIKIANVSKPEAAFKSKAELRTCTRCERKESAGDVNTCSSDQKPKNTRSYKICKTGHVQSINTCKVITLFQTPDERKYQNKMFV